MSEDKEKVDMWKRLLHRVADAATTSWASFRRAKGRKGEHNLEDEYATIWALANWISRRVPHALAQERAIQARGVHNWAKEILAGGASRAHLWTKPVEEWRPEMVGFMEQEEDTIAASTDKAAAKARTRSTAGPIQVLEDQRKIWKRVWRATEKPKVGEDQRLWEILDKLVQEQEAQLERTWEQRDALTATERKKVEVVRNLYQPLTAQRVAGAARKFKERTTKMAGFTQGTQGG